MNELADKSLEIASEYLGPAAEIFMEKQASYHMTGLKLDNLKREHLPEFSRWIKRSAALFIDEDKAEEFSRRIANL